MQSIKHCPVLRHLFSVTMFATAAFVPASWAADVSYDFVACTHSRRTPLEASADLTAFGMESWGVVSSSTTKEWENATTRCVGYLRVMAGKPVGKGVCKWFTANGDTGVGEFEYPPSGEPTWTWLVGTGKLAGIAGGGTFKSLFAGKPAEPGTTQGCRRDWGKYTLP
jgi:hypothetical protein